MLIRKLLGVAKLKISTFSNEIKVINLTAWLSSINMEDIKIQ